MNTQNRVFKKLAQAEKVELSAQKIELANLNQLKAGIKKVEKDLKAGQKYENQYKKLTGEADDLARKFLSLSSDGKMGIPLSVNLFTMSKIRIQREPKEKYFIKNYIFYYNEYYNFKKTKNIFGLKT